MADAQGRSHSQNPPNAPTLGMTTTIELPCSFDISVIPELCDLASMDR